MRGGEKCVGGGCGVEVLVLAWILVWWICGIWEGLVWAHRLWQWKRDQQEASFWRASCRVCGSCFVVESDVFGDDDKSCACWVDAKFWAGLSSAISGLSPWIQEHFVTTSQELQ
jgi:hypothetical protein